MRSHDVPQPAVERLVPFAGHPAVVGVVPGQPALVALTALAWAQAVGAPALHFAYADTSRYVVEEFPDGRIRHAGMDPDAAADTWRQVEHDLRSHLGQILGDTDVPWQLHYLAGRPDRALTHLARAVDAAVLIVGTHAPGAGRKVHELLEGSVAAHLARHQHRPVPTVPLSVVDWKATPSAWDR